MNNQTSNSIGRVKIATIFGGSGFVGRYVVGQLAKKGYQIRVAVRRPDLAFHLQPLGNVGQIQAIQTNLRYPWSVERAIEGSDVVVNLVGILRESGKQSFDKVHAEGAELIAKQCSKRKIPMVHLSSIGADPDSTSSYCASKGRGEELIRKAHRSAVILRSSIIFGNEDEFFNRFAEMATLSPFLPLIGGGKTKFQPVYVGDVAKAIVAGVEGRLSSTKIYELGGQEVLTFRECMEEMLTIIGRKKSFVHIPFAIASFIAKMTGWIPGSPMSADQVEILKGDNIVSDEAKKRKLTLQGIGIEPRTMASILPSYLVRFRVNGQYSKDLLSEAEDQQSM